VDAKQILALYDEDRKRVLLSGMRREVTAHLVRHISADGEGLIIYSNLDSANADEVIQEQMAHFGDAGRDSSWVVYEHDTPPDLRDRLLARGFRVEEPESIMVLDVEDASPVLLEPIQHDVRKIDDPGKIDDVLSIRQEVWQDVSASTAQSLAGRLNNAPHGQSLYVAYDDGKPVSTAQISFYRYGRFASLVRAATLPEYRRRGLYTALLAVRVQEAQSRGIRFLDADASSMSRPIMARLGFQQVSEAHTCVWSTQGPSPG
jgi:GNAT superfamily N-acetyltransferase